MKIQTIRNATMRIAYLGHVILTDPFFAEKHTLRSFGGEVKNPLVDLPIPVGEILAGVEMILISHLHIDHFDEAAWSVIEKDIPVYCQPGDENTIRDKGFTDVTTLEGETVWQGIKITRVDGQHGVGEWIEKMGKVSGFVLQPGEPSDEPSLYWTGDTIYYPQLEENIRVYAPDVILTHSNGAKFGDADPIVMDAAQTVNTIRAAGDARVVAVHMGVTDHGTVTREELREYALEYEIGPDQLLIPQDGETLHFG